MSTGPVDKLVWTWDGIADSILWVDHCRFTLKKASTLLIDSVTYFRDLMKNVVLRTFLTIRVHSQVSSLYADGSPGMGNRTNLHLFLLSAKSALCMHICIANSHSEHSEFYLDPVHCSPWVTFLVQWVLHLTLEQPGIDRLGHREWKPVAQSRKSSGNFSLIR